MGIVTLTHAQLFTLHRRWGFSPQSAPPPANAKPSNHSELCSNETPSRVSWFYTRLTEPFSTRSTKCRCLRKLRLAAFFQAACALPVPLQSLVHASQPDSHEDKRHWQSFHKQSQKRKSKRDREECRHRCGLEGSRRQWLILAQPDARDSRFKDTIALRVGLPGDSVRAKADSPLKSNLEKAFGFGSFRVVV